MPRMGPGRSYMTVTLPTEVMEAAKAEAGRRKEKMAFVIQRLLEKYSGLKVSKTPAKRGRPKNLEESEKIPG